VNPESIKNTEKLINALEGKIADFNSLYNRKIRVSQAKQVFVKAAQDHGDHNLIEYCFARLNLFLRIASGDFSSFSSKGGQNLQTINIASSIQLNEDDFSAANSDIKKYDIDFELNSINDVYLDYKPLSLVSSLL